MPKLGVSLGPLLACVPAMWALQAVQQDGPAVPYWAGKNGDQLRTGSSPYTAPSQLEGGPTWSWTEEKNGLVRSAPLIDADLNIYISTINGRVLKLTPEGKTLWEYRASGGLPDVPALLDNVLYTCTKKGEVIALDAATGSKIWASKVAKSSSGDTWSMTAAEGVVVVGVLRSAAQANNRLVALDAKDGKQLWTHDLKDEVYNVLSSVKNGALVFSDLHGRAFRLGLHDGSVVWETDAPPNAGSSTGGAVIGPNGVVYVTSNQANPGVRRKLSMAATLNNKQHGLISAYNFDDGKLIWRTELPMQANNAASVGSLTPGGRLSLAIGTGMNPNIPVVGRLVFPKEKPGRIYTLDAETGKIGWSFDLPIWKKNGAVAAGDNLGHVCLPDSFSNAVIGGDGTVYVGFMDGSLYAVRDKDGDGVIDPKSEASSYDFKNAFQGSPALAPGLLVAAPCNGLHVFDGRPKAQP